MKQILLVLIFPLITTISFSQLTPHTVDMSTGDNATAFGSAGTLGTDAATFYLHWDATYLYLGWSGGSTDYGFPLSTSSDMYYAAIDVDPQPSSGGTLTGTSNSFNNVGFSSAAMDFLVLYENNRYFNGVPVTEGNAFEFWLEDSGNWGFDSRNGGGDGTNSAVTFGTPGEMRVRIPWSLLGITPGLGNDFSIVMWTNNSNANFVWGRWPNTNPAGSTPKTLNRVMYFHTTQDGVAPNSSWGPGVLPVTLESFEANVTNNNINLHWTTASELNNSHFEIERSADGYSWTTIGQISGAGNSTSINNYSFFDSNPALGQNYYRLRQVDFNGDFEYSDVVTAFMGGKAATMISPNPASDMLNVPAGATLSIFDITGKRLLYTISTGTPIDISELPAGYYTAEVVMSDSRVVEALIIQ